MAFSAGKLSNYRLVAILITWTTTYIWTSGFAGRSVNYLSIAMRYIKAPASRSWGSLSRNCLVLTLNSCDNFFVQRQRIFIIVLFYNTSTNFFFFQTVRNSANWSRRNSVTLLKWKSLFSGCNVRMVIYFIGGIQSRWRCNIHDEYMMSFFPPVHLCLKKFKTYKWHY